MARKYRSRVIADKLDVKIEQQKVRVYDKINSLDGEGKQK